MKFMGYIAKLAVLWGLLGFCWSSVTWAQRDPEKAAEEIRSLIDHWQTDAARRAIQPWLERDGDAPLFVVLNAQLLYYEGKYADAVSELNRLETLTSEWPEGLQTFRAEVESTRQALVGYDEFRSENGRFVVRYKGRDRILLPWILDVLQRQDDALAAHWGGRSEGSVLVEIYPRHEVLAAVTPLTEKDLETSGTIALCKYNKLMVTSPGGLVRGYGWRDTVAHEFVHYYITKLSGETVPIWLHEGIAKFDEAAWHREPDSPMDPPEEDLLARSLEAKKLITFEQMHPSMAKLPSQEAASLAYAEVHSVLKMLYQKKGYDGLKQLVQNLDQKLPMDLALKAVYGLDLQSLWTDWGKWALKQGLHTWPGLKHISLKFKRPGETEEEDDYDSVEDKKAKDFAKLGELLRARERPLAALREYEKAMAVAGEGLPTVQNGASAALLSLNRPEKVPELLRLVRVYYPTLVTTWLHLGEAYLKMGDLDRAIEAFEEAVGINPFYPLPHEALAALYTQKGREKEASLARAALEILK